jgi:phosphate:Na+ symporter
MAAVMLLLFAVQMIRTGIEQRFGAMFKHQLTQRQSLPGAGLTGLVLAIVLQSSAAVAVLVAGFSAGGYMMFATGLAIVLGGDLGSALLIQLLSFKMDWLVPVLLALGGWLFVKNHQKSRRQLGSILLGIAFVLLSLQFLKDAVEPIRESAFLPAIANYLETDFVTAFLVGAVLAFVMHSSVATILMCVALLQIGTIPFGAAVSLVLGANLGSGFIPIWLTRGMPPEAQRIPIANVALRGGWAVIILLTLNMLLSPDILIVAGPTQSLIWAHIAFNFSLLLLALPFCRLIEGPVARLLPSTSQSAGEPTSPDPSALNTAVLAHPPQAIAGLKRELLRMTVQVEQMYARIPDLFETADPDVIIQLQAQDKNVNRMLSGIRNYIVSVPGDTYSKQEMKVLKGLVDYAIRLEAAGDVVSKRLADLAKTKNDGKLQFSPEGRKEIADIHDTIAANFAQASNVLISDDLDGARLLVTEKANLKKEERKSRKRHLERIHAGRSDSLQSSDLHLETLRALRDINSHICAVAYPILYRNGQLLKTRLIHKI